MRQTSRSLLSAVFLASGPTVLGSPDSLVQGRLAAEGACRSTDPAQGCSSLIQSFSVKRKVHFDSANDQGDENDTGHGTKHGSGHGTTPQMQDGVQANASMEPPAVVQDVGEPPGLVRKGQVHGLGLMEPAGAGTHLLELEPTFSGPGDRISSIAELRHLSGTLWRTATAQFIQSMKGVHRRITSIEAQSSLFTVLVIVGVVMLCMACTALVTTHEASAYWKEAPTRDGSKGPKEVWRNPLFGRKMSNPSLGQLTDRQPPQKSRDSQEQQRLTAPRNTSDRLTPSDGSFLCPGLVVPSGCECTLLVPRLNLQNPHMRSSHGQVTVDDIKGVPVFRVTFTIPSLGLQQSSKDSSPAEQGNGCLILASTATDAAVFASCRDSAVELGFERSALAIFDSAGRPFGSLRMCGGEGDGFEVVTGAGSWYHIGCSENGVATATDRRGRSPFLAEPSAEVPHCRLVRIGPLVDAGLFLVSMLCCDLLETAVVLRGKEATPPASSSSVPVFSGSSRHALPSMK